MSMTAGGVVPSIDGFTEVGERSLDADLRELAVLVTSLSHVSTSILRCLENASSAHAPRHSQAQHANGSTRTRIRMHRNHSAVPVHAHASSRLGACESYGG
eukprot:836518-Rhodomonas_salina.2